MTKPNGADSLMQIPWVESPFFETILDSRKLSPPDEKTVRTYHDQGYLVLDDVLSSPECDRIISEVAPAYDPAIADGPRSRHRVQDAWRASPAVKSLAIQKRILEVLRLLYDREPIPFQTLNFSAGTQQPAHSDLTHFSCYPERYMCGVWVALEDITSDNGPLFYYKGSHALPVLGFSDFDSSIDDEKLHERYDAFLSLLGHRFPAALIWSANLWHGGDAIQKKGSTRHSQVTHYYFENCFYFFPHNSTPILGHYDLKDIVDIRTDKKVEHTFHGRPVDLVPLGGKKTFIAPRGSGLKPGG
jgi:ectoine hydroxylase-related dioxygenase (phytanoyl-CoA dioxygenase family)